MGLIISHVKSPGVYVRNMGKSLKGIELHGKTVCQIYKSECLGLESKNQPFYKHVTTDEVVG